MFYGESEHNLDDKGRLIVPVRHRPAFDEGLFVTRGLESCLWIFTLETWRDISARLSDARMMNHDARQLERLLYSGSETSLDKQGRLLVPSSLRSYSGLEENGVAVVVGVKNRLELWNLERWTALTAKLGQEGSSFAESMSELGI
jgi:MraZ protein